MRIYKILSEIFADRQLLIALSAKDFQRKFSGTFFGTAWGILNPLLTMIVYWVAFQYGFHSSDVGGVPYVVWFMCGIVPWLFVTEAFSSASNSFVEYSYLIKKVKFNINILPLVKILSAGFVHALFICLVLAIAIIFRIMPTLYILQLVYYMIANVMLLFSLSLITASVVVFFRDLNQIISVLLLAGMWGTPIAWSLEGFSTSVHFWFKLNPFFYVIEGYRDAILGRKWFWQMPRLTIYFWVFVAVLLMIGGVVYGRLKPHFAETV
ncbi:MAG: ABC transporter permease [Eubacteriales bacterium]|nr:ABC transporter permease [Eubacteriales bacterium]